MMQSDVLSLVDLINSKIINKIENIMKISILTNNRNHTNFTNFLNAKLFIFQKRI